MIFSWNNIKILKKDEGAKEYYIYADLLMKIIFPKYDFFWSENEYFFGYYSMSLMLILTKIPIKLNANK